MFLLQTQATWIEAPNIQVKAPHFVEKFIYF